MDHLGGTVDNDEDGIIHDGVFGDWGKTSNPIHSEGLPLLGWQGDGVKLATREMMVCFHPLTNVASADMGLNCAVNVGKDKTAAY